MGLQPDTCGATGRAYGMRSGTLNVPGIVGFGAAAALAKREMNAKSKRMRKLTELLLAGWRSTAARPSDCRTT